MDSKKGEKKKKKKEGSPLLGETKKRGNQNASGVFAERNGRASKSSGTESGGRKKKRGFRFLEKSL